MNRATLSAVTDEAIAARVAAENADADDWHALAASVAADWRLATACRSAVPVLLRRLDLAEQALAALLDALPSGMSHRMWAARFDARAALSELRRPLDQPEETT